MSVLLLASLAVLAAATLTSVVVMLRSGETRVALLTGLLVLLAVQQSVALVQSWEEPLAFDLATGTALAGFAVALLGLLTVVAVGRTLADLERAEALHWESMEGVRGLTELASRREVDLADRLPLLLGMGCERLGLEIGLVSRVRNGRYEVVAIHAPPGFPIAPGATFDLEETFCRAALESDRPVAVSRAADAHWVANPARNAFRFEAYLGHAIRVHGEPRGTLVFAGLTPRAERFTASHKDLLVLMGQWIGAELERQEVDEARRQEAERAAAEADRSAATAAAVRRARRRVPRVAPRGTDLDATVARLEKRIRRLLPADVELVVERTPGLPVARAQRLPLDAIVLSLARHAAEALPEGGSVTLATARHEPVGEPGVMTAVAPARYVTLSVLESSGALDADAFTRSFDGGGPAGAEAEGGLPLSTVYRLLHRAGGDLSVEVEPGRGSRFTVFLPIAEGGEDEVAVTAAGQTTPPAASTDAPPTTVASGH